MKYIVAVSGGVDSVVLLDMLAKQHDVQDLVVAHFEHGIRGKESQDDCLFVEKLSQLYGIKFEYAHGNLTQTASEAEAREKRYEFLRAAAEKHDARIVTAHHQDDMIETIALNLQRGTGWRGLAVFDSPSVHRPLQGMTKAQLYDYALTHGLEWVEDETNSDARYQRNRLRKRMSQLDEASKQRLVQLRNQQLELREYIDAEAKTFVGERRRYFYTMIPETVAIELLKRETEHRLLHEQLQRLLVAIKTTKPGTRMQPGDGLMIEFSRRSFTTKNTSELL